MKLQKPPRLHSPFSFWRQQASRKSVTGESSAYSGRPGYCHRRQGVHEGERLTCIPAIVEIINSRLGFRFPFIPRIDVSNQMVTYVVADLRKLTLNSTSVFERWRCDSTCNSKRC